MNTQDDHPGRRLRSAPELDLDEKDIAVAQGQCPDMPPSTASVVPVM
jgi:hypothetical protein